MNTDQHRLKTISCSIAVYLCLSVARSFFQHTVPPHHGAGYEHGSGGESEDGPKQLHGLVAESWALAGNPDAVDAADVQVGKPIGDLIDDARPGVGVGERLDAVGQVLKPVRVAEI